MKANQVGAASVIAMFLLVSTANAQTPPANSDALVERPSLSKPSEPVAIDKAVWYGAPSVVTDSVSIGLVTAGALSVGALSNSDFQYGMMLTGLAGYTFGGPIVHAASGRWGAAGASLGIRAVPWVVLGVLRNASNNEDIGNWAFVGAALAAMIVDDAVLSWKDAPKKNMSPVGVMPAINFKTGGVSMNVSGAF